MVTYVKMHVVKHIKKSLEQHTERNITTVRRERVSERNEIIYKLSNLIKKLVHKYIFIIKRIFILFSIGFSVLQNNNLMSILSLI